MDSRGRFMGTIALLVMGGCTSAQDEFATAQRLQFGDGGGNNLTQAAALYRHACDRESGPACLALGRMVSAGEGAPQSDSVAFEMLKRSCDLKNQEGCVAAAGALEAGRGVPRDLGQAGYTYRRACDRGNAAACLGLAMLLGRKGAGPVDDSQLRGLFNTACDAGLALGCTQLAALTSDPAAAFALHKAACERGESEACRRVGEAYEAGNGTPKDLEAAAAAYGQGCGNGFLSACTALGVNRLGSGKGPDASGPLEKACSGGEGHACFLLGSALRKGTAGVAKDEASAISAFKRGCEFGSRPSCQAVEEVSARPALDADACLRRCVPRCRARKTCLSTCKRECHKA